MEFRSTERDGQLIEAHITCNALNQVATIPNHTKPGEVSDLADEAQKLSNNETWFWCQEHWKLPQSALRQSKRPPGGGPCLVCGRPSGPAGRLGLVIGPFQLTEQPPRQTTH